jgi:tetrahydromethanopterin S-methyltransferase subunit H
MNGEALRDEYIEALLDKITTVRYPSHELIARAEKVVYKREQAERLLRYLISTVDDVQYPSHQIMDRIERILFAYPGRPYQQSL